MTKIIRSIHSFAGLILLVWILMYFLTGYVMTHPSMFPRAAPQRQITTESLNWPGQRNTVEFARYLEETYHLQGKRQEPKHQGDGTWKFAWSRPGYYQEAVVSADGTHAEITRTETGAVNMAHGLHRLHGYGGGLKYDVWVFCYDLASAAMLVFVITGIQLWWKTTRQHLPGWLCLAAGFGFTGAVIAHLVFSP